MFCCSFHVQLPSSVLFHTSCAYNFDVNYWNYPACACILVKICGSVLLSPLLNSTDTHLYQLPFLKIEIIPLASFSVMPRKYITHEDVFCHKELSWKWTWYYIQFLRAYLILCLQDIFLFPHRLIIGISSRTAEKLILIFLFGGEVSVKMLDEMKLSCCFSIVVKSWLLWYLNDSLLKKDLQTLVSSSQLVLLFSTKMLSSGTP